MSQRRILVVDDESYITVVIGQKLRQNGFDVIVAGDGDEAYEVACRERLHLIVTDFQMPVLNGFELAVKLKANPRTAEIPVLMLTARGHHLLASELMRTNIQYLMAKPFSAKELAKKVEELVTASDVILESCASKEGAR